MRSVQVIGKKILPRSFHKQEAGQDILPDLNVKQVLEIVLQSAKRDLPSLPNIANGLFHLRNLKERKILLWELAKKIKSAEDVQEVEDLFRVFENLFRECNESKHSAGRLPGSIVCDPFENNPEEVKEVIKILGEIAQSAENIIIAKRAIKSFEIIIHSMLYNIRIKLRDKNRILKQEINAIKFKFEEASLIFDILNRIIMDAIRGPRGKENPEFLELARNVRNEMGIVKQCLKLLFRELQKIFNQKQLGPIKDAYIAVLERC